MIALTDIEPVAKRIARQLLARTRTLPQMLHPKRTLGFPLFPIHHAEFLLVEFSASQQATRIQDRVWEMERSPQKEIQRFFLLGARRDHRVLLLGRTKA